MKGQNRGSERVVIGDDGSVWYTNDHYHTFIKIERGVKNGLVSRDCFETKIKRGFI